MMSSYAPSCIVLHSIVKTLCKPDDIPAKVHDKALCVIANEFSLQWNARIVQALLSALRQFAQTSAPLSDEARRGRCEFALKLPFLYLYLTLPYLSLSVS